MLLTLNEDCLRLICNALDIESQIAWIFTCQHLRHIVSEVYRSPKAVCISANLWRYFYDHEKHFELFFQCIGDNLSYLALDGLDGGKLHLLQHIRVPKLKTFTFSVARVLDYEEEPKIKANFRALISSMSNSLEELMLQGISHKLLFTLYDLKFPELTRCGLLLRRVAYEPGNIHEADILVKMFPKLTNLLLLTDTFGHNLWQLEHLTELILINCYNFVAEHMTQVFETLKLRKLVFKPFDGIGCYEDEDYFHAVAACQTLEELSVEYHHLGVLTNELPKLKNLRSLTFTPKESCFCHYKPESFLIKFAHHYGFAMDTLIFSHVPFDMTHEDYLPFLQSMRNLRRLIFVDSFPKTELLRAVAQAAGTSLEEFRYIRSSNNINVNEGLMEILRHCTNVKTFDISAGKTDIGFLKEAVDVQSHRIKDRPEPLTLRCHNTAIMEDHLENLPLPQNIKISFQYEDLPRTSLETIHCEWNPDMVEYSFGAQFE